MRCVNDTLPPRERRKWLLMTTRLSMSSLAGIARTEVAVGTASEASMLVTTRAAGPRSFCGSTGPAAGVDAVRARAVAAVVVETGGGVGVSGAGDGGAGVAAAGLGAAGGFAGRTAVAPVVGGVGPFGLAEPSAGGR